MTDQFWLTPAQLNRIKPHFPLSHGVPRVDVPLTESLAALGQADRGEDGKFAA